MLDGVEFDEVEKLDVMLIAAEPDEPERVIGDPSEDEADDDDEFEDDEEDSEDVDDE